VRYEVLVSVRMMMMMFIWVDAAYICGLIPEFQRNIATPFSGLKKETVCISETLLSTYKSTGHHNPE
jgi:hypothetical protein